MFRKMEYISPSGLAKYIDNRDEFFLEYMCQFRPPRMPQTKAMAVGSAFDAYVKSFLHEKLYGRITDSRFELVAIFEAQVEKHNRDWAWTHGKHAFECYARSGALADLLLELESSIGTPRFEFELKGAIHGQREGVTRVMHEGVVFLGRPDIFYINKHGCHVILDFKVNGWVSKSAISPKAGYVKIRAGSGQPMLSGPHKDCLPQLWRGSIINYGRHLEDIDQSWARQLAIYGWLAGCEIGDEFLTAIDQIVCKPTSGEFPEVRVAEHRLRIHSDFQWQTYAKAQELWTINTDGHYFRELTREASDKRCEVLAEQAMQLAKPKNEKDEMFNKIARGF